MTSLNSLKSYDRLTAANILAVAALLAAPNPGVGESLFDNKLITPASEVLAEISSRVEARKRTSDGRKESVSAFLSREIYSLIQNDKTADEALERAGQAGRLMPSFHKVIQSKEFRQRFAPLGVTKNDVEKTVSSPSDYHHIFYDDVPEDNKEDLSIFMRSFEGAGQDIYWLLVQAVRSGVEQKVTSAWRIYVSDVNLVGAENPLDALRAFVDVYGMPVTVAGETSKFVERVIVPSKNGRATWDVEAQVGLFKETFVQVSFVKNIDPNFFTVGVGYMIDIDKYRSDLRRHDRKISKV